MPRQQRTVCCCVSHGCSQYTHRDSDGRTQPGLLIALPVFARHRLDDAARASINSNSIINNPSSDTPADLSPNQETMSPTELAQLLQDTSLSLPGEHVSTADPDVASPELEAGAQTSGQPETSEPSNEGLQSSSGLLDEAETSTTLLPYDCDHFINFSLKTSNPVILHASLVAAILNVLGHCSRSTSSWVLSAESDLLQLMACIGLANFAQDRGQLTYADNAILKSMALDIRTVIRWLDLDPKLITVVCCPSCFAMYPPQANPPIHCQRLLQGRLHGDQAFDETDRLNDASIDDANREDDDLINISDPGTCGTLLFQTRGEQMVPVKQFAFQNLFDWLARFFSRAGIEDALDESLIKSNQPFERDSPCSDIHDSRVWKQFLGPDGSQFTARSGNLTFGMFMDAINPYGNRQAGKHASITFIVLICLTLPINLRYLPENIFLVGIAPGPREPSLEQTNWIIRPVVEQLKTLWSTGLKFSQTRKYPQGRHIYCALLPFFADLPALRRALGFAGPSATRMCSFCLLTKKEINNLDSATWPSRSLEAHRTWATESRDAPSLKAQMKILRDHGVRYSVLLELPYWDITQYHVVDSMHNLLLGLIQWHCRRFWLMKDIDDEPEPKSVPARELMDILADAAHSPQPPSLPTDPPSDHHIEPDFLEMAFGSNTASSDDDFCPDLSDAGWDGKWTPPSDGKIILDSHALAHINAMLPQIHIPTWIKRAIPILGKASFGRLKADEWRNLCTIQLPLVLPTLWKSSEPVEQSLLHNFAHLASLVNLALKRSLTQETCTQYRHYILSYLESSRTLFENTRLAPNHHMAMHLADCLERFGPVRAWWSFPLERLMGQVLQATHNNQIGQLEITFLTTFCRGGNLRALLDSDKLPSVLEPFLPQLRSFYDGETFVPRTTTNERSKVLNSSVFKDLVNHLNHKFPIDGYKWVPSDQDQRRFSADAPKPLPVISRGDFTTKISVKDVVYSTFANNPNNSVVALAPTTPARTNSFGMIKQIFKHKRQAPNNQQHADIWLVINTFPPLPPGTVSPYAKLAEYPMQLSLRLFEPQEQNLFHLDDVQAHCAWIKFKPREISSKIAFPTIALVCLDR